MPTAGLFLLLLGSLFMRQVVVGRVKETPSDLKDLSLAVLAGDTAKIQSTLSARGNNVAVPGSSGMVAGDEPGTAAPSSDVLQAATALGQAAKGYRWGATGPDYYDCSGLVWRALKKTNHYDGARFTTSTFDAVFPKFAEKVTTPAAGDIVVWKGKHMGIVSGADSYYSARSVSKGIGYSSLSDDVDYFAGITPSYWRVK